jgi:hypothetical protein
MGKGALASCVKIRPWKSLVFNLNTRCKDGEGKGGCRDKPFQWWAQQLLGALLINGA